MSRRREMTGVAVIAVIVALLIALLPAAAGSRAREKRTPQAISFELPATAAVGEIIELKGTASSGLPLDYHAKPRSRCVIEGKLLHLEAEGTCKVEATQPGDDIHAAADMRLSLEVVVSVTEPAPKPEARPKAKAKSEPKPVAQPKSEPKPVAQPKAPESTTAPKRTSDVKRSKPVPKVERAEQARSETGLPAPMTRQDPKVEQAIQPAATLPTLTIEGGATYEGDSATTSVKILALVSPSPSTPVTFDWVTADGTAIAGSGFDYLAGSGTATIPAGGKSAEFTVTINGDPLVEFNEYFEVRISNWDGATYDGSAVQGVILNDDTATLTIEDRAVDEGDDTPPNRLEFVAWLSKPSAIPVSFDYETAGGTATAGADFYAQSGSVAFTGRMDPFVDVQVIPDAVVEPDEHFELQISNVEPADLVIHDGSSAVGTIRNDDWPYISVTSSNLPEGDTSPLDFDFQVQLSDPAPEDVWFTYQTEDVTAEAGDDYGPVSGTGAISMGEQWSANIHVPIYGDTDVELDEEFRLVITGATNATFDAESTGVRKILNDDWPTLRVAGTSVPEGDSGTIELPLGVYLSEIAPFPVAFDYATMPVTATANVDYAAASGRFEIPAGVAADPLPLPFTVYGDTVDEPDEMFMVDISNVSGATYDVSGSNAYEVIVDDDVPGISVADTQVTEGAGGVVVEISLNSAGVEPVSVHYATADGSATAGSDYTAVSGDATFHPGLMYRYVTVPFIDDTLDEPDETFTLVLSDPVGGAIADGSGTNTIIDDDPPSPDPSVPPSPDPAPPADTTSPTVSVPSVDIPRGRSIAKTATPIPLLVTFTASDPSGIADTELQHRIGAGAFADVPLASATATRATVRVATSSKLVHRLRSRARDAATPANTSAFQTTSFTVRVRQDGVRAVKQRGPWRQKRARSYLGRTVRATSTAGARQMLTAVGTDFAVVSTKGPNRGRAEVLLDGRRVAVIDLYAARTKPRSIIYAVSFPTAGKHTVVLKATGTKSRVSTGKRVDLDAFLVLTSP